MNKLIRPAVGILRRNTQVTPVARISTNKALFAEKSFGAEKNVGTWADQKFGQYKYIVLGGIVGGIAFAYYEYQQGAIPLYKDEEKK